MPRPLEVFLRFLRLGLTAFGGPVAHLGYFRREFVERARWLDDAAFTELVALCSVLPGPTSSQVGMLLGAKRAGPFGALAAWLAFTFPSALVLAIVAWLGRADFQAGQRGIAAVAANPNLSIALAGAVTGLIFTAYAVVLLAVVTLARAIVTTRFANVFVCAAFAVSLAALTYAPAFSWIALALGALAGALFAPHASVAKSATLIRVSREVGIGAFVLLAGTLAALFALPADGYGNIFATTFRAGSLVFGGGHVVLGFLTPFVSDRGVTLAQFQAGYGVTQAMPGPLFTFASFLGAADPSAPNAFAGALVGTIGIFLPSFLILPAALALWNIVREAPRAGAVLAGLNVAVVGLLAATFVDLVRAGILHGGLRSPIVGAIIGIIAFALLTRAKWPAWAVVLSMAFGGAAYALAAATLQFPYVLRLGQPPGTFARAWEQMPDMFEGSRTFDIAWGTTTAAVCFALGAIVIWSWVVQRRVNGPSIFGRTLDPGRGLQLAWGIFAMGMGGTNLGCRYIDHRYLSGVHEGFFALTLLVVAVLSLPAFRIIRNAAANRRTTA